MGAMRIATIAVVGLVALTFGTAVTQGQGQGQGGGGGRGRAGGAPPAPSNLPEAPTAVALPTLSAEVTGPGPMFDSASSLAPGKGLPAFGYEAHEYFVSGTANGEPYTTRLVVRKPADNSKFSGLVLAEAMHGSGSSHMFEFTSIYTMSSGHAAVEILTTAPAQFVALNEARYRNLKLSGPQTNEILAQVGALVRSGTPGRRSGPEDGDGRHVDDGRGGHQLPAGAHGLPDAADAAHLRRLPADVQRRADPRRRRAGDPHPDDARSGRQHHQQAGQRRGGQAVPALRVLGDGPHRHA